MTTTRLLRASIAAVAVAVGLFATAAPAHAGGVHIGFSAAIVAPPLVVSVGNLAPVSPYPVPYRAGCALPGAYAPGYVPYAAPYGVPYAAPYAAPYRAFAPGAAFVRVWVPGPRPHWEMRRSAAFHHRRW